MGVYIKGMEMPIDCLHCCFASGCSYCEGYNDHCTFEPDDIKTDWDFAHGVFPGSIPDWCPLVPIPPHGDLIDRDALRESIGESIEECHKWADEVDRDTMMYARISQSLGTFVECSLRAKAAPTIIQAEGGE